MADPLLEKKYPVKGLYQALAIASMCIQEEASSRPKIGDVVAALTFLAEQKYCPPQERQAGKRASEDPKSQAKSRERDCSNPPKTDMVSEIKADDETIHR